MAQITTSEKARILYIDDNQTNLVLFKEMFGDRYEVHITSSKDAALKELGNREYKAVFVDYLMPDILGLEFVSLAKELSPDSPYLIITAYAKLEVAISAINSGNVFRFLEKPFREIDVLHAIDSAIEIYDLRKRNRELIENIKQKNKELTLLKEKLEEENQYLQEEITSSIFFDEIISMDPAFEPVIKKVEQVSGTQATVLVLGETGTGKELIARAIHKLSKRSNKPFIKLNCATIPPTLIESELFGHVRGAFTGAVENKKGKFELAHLGTIFLDEIGELPLDMQPKLLRVLQEGEIEKVGGKDAIKVDVRIIAATNRVLEHEMETGNFRKDLFYRLNVFPVILPPLRERPGDIPVLAEHFVKKYNGANNKSIKRIPGKIMDQLVRYHWPGNIRELQNVIERAVIISTGNQLDLMDALMHHPMEQGSGDRDFQTLEEMEKEYIEDVLQRTNFRVSGEKGAAKILGMNSTTLESRIKKLGIVKP